MKRLLVIFITIISALCCVFGLTACDSSVNYVAATCVFDNDVTVLPVKFKKAYMGGYFIPAENCSLEVIKADVGKLSGKGVTYECEIYGDYLLIEKTEGEKLHYYLVVRTELYYYFVSPTAMMRTVSRDCEIILFPYHLTCISSEEFESKHGNEIDEIIRLSGTREQVKDFYVKQNMFDITDSGDILTVKLKDGYERPERVGSYFHTDKAFTITFGEDEEGKYAVYGLVE